MSRHRDIRNLDYDEEYDDAYDDTVYGHSVEDNEYGFSPNSENYLYCNKRDENFAIGNYFPDSENIKEEEIENQSLERRDSRNFERPRLTSENEARLNSILDEIRNVVGDHFHDHELIPMVLKHEYDLESTLNELLNKKTGSLPSSNSSLDDRKQKCSPSSVNKTTVRDVRRLDKKRNLPDDAGSSSQGKVAGREGSPVIVKTPAKSGVKGFKPKVNGDLHSTSTEDACNEIAGLSLEDGPKDNEAASTPKPLPRIRDKAVDIEQKYKELRGESKELLNLVVIGHVDAGKSTLMGHLLYLQGVIGQRTMHKYEHESKKIGKQSFMYAWVLDDTEEERSRGVTVDIAQRVFSCGSKTITVLDAPGHRDFIPNMITGAARADVALLVVDASTGGFEAGFESGGQTREHAILVKSLGVSEMVVAVNKLDLAEWSQARFGEVVGALEQFLKCVGFRTSDVTYVPCSGLAGENLAKAASEPKLTAWYQGDCLLSAIEKLKVPQRSLLKPVRLCINDIYKAQGAAMCVAGKLDHGYLQPGDRLLLLPHSEVATVKGVQSDHADSFNCCFAGDHVTLTVSGVDPNALHAGDFLCDPQKPVGLALRAHARIVVFNVVVPIIKGSQFDFHYQCVSEGCRVKKLLALVHKSTGQVLKSRPRALLKNSSALVELQFDRPLCLELYKDCKEMGRFMLRNKGNTVAAGMIVLILN